MQGRQRLFVVLAGGGQFRAVAGGNRLQLAIAPAGLIGDEHNAFGVADQQQVAALAPFVFQFGKLQFHHHGTEKIARVAGDGVR